MKLSELTARQAVFEVAKMYQSCFVRAHLVSIHTVHDEVKDKEFELEMSWICPESGNQHQLVPKALLAEAQKAAKTALEADMEEEKQ